ncbi:hypothetical protein ES332_A11G111000v1 [Gossypium tomentosum]|uniref:Uncharacterized protein n=1 Tax=Gossypium tomentosum TaxID=34277 RepID=A0A5D2N822_GOSTO|nr:hypothetical protein ES332_A11G111000v1 [Gossypium tomentosum]
MGSEEEKESTYTPKLPLFSASHAHMQSPERSGMLTPPLHASASVPFRWEEEPGKPKPCTALTSFTTLNDSAPKCLELPPRLLLDAKIAKLSSPTTVLEGPYTGRPRFQSSSFRMGSEFYGSFRASPETLQLGSMVLSKRGYKEKGFLGFWRGRSLKARPRRKLAGTVALGIVNAAETETETETAVAPPVLISPQLEGLVAFPVSLVPSPTSGKVSMKA